MNQMKTERRAAVIRCLVEGNSIRSTVRITGAAKNTVTKLLVDLGKACLTYHDANVRGLACKNIQCDEIWSFVGCKQQHLAKQTSENLHRGDIWTWTALDSDSKLMVSYAVGQRSASYGEVFMRDVASRLTNRVQMTTDGYRVYLSSVLKAFGFEIDYAQLQKIYGKDWAGEKRYSPAECLGAVTKPMIGNPDLDKANTSYVERQNLTMRMHMRRFTRLTNAFSKKLENHEHAVALHFMNYNYCRKHQTIKTTPAIAAGLTDHIWTIEELIETVLHSN